MKMIATFILALLILITPAAAHEISFQTIKTFTNHYNSFYEKSPQVFESLVGTANIKVVYTLLDGHTIAFGVNVTKGKVVKYLPIPYKDSTITVTVSEETMNRISASSDPVSEFRNAWGGDIKVEGITLASKVKIFVANAVTTILSSRTTVPIKVEGSILNYELINSSSSKDYPNILLGQYAASEDIGPCGFMQRVRYEYITIPGLSVTMKSDDGSWCRNVPVNLCRNLTPVFPTMSRPYFKIVENVPIGHKNYSFSINLPDGWGMAPDNRVHAVGGEIMYVSNRSTSNYYSIIAIKQGQPTPPRVYCDNQTTTSTTTTSSTTTTNALELCSDKVVIMNSKLPVATSSSSAVWDGKNAYIFWKSDIYKYEPTTDQIQTVYNNLTPSDRRTTSAIYNGSFAFVFGGEAGKDGTYDFHTLEDISKYDTKNNIFTKQSSTLNPSLGLTSSIWDGKNAYIFGGFNSSGGSSTDILRYDTRTDTLSKMRAKLPEPLQTTAAAWDGKNAYIFGGHSQPLGDFMNDEIYRYDPSTDTIVKMSSKLPNAMQAMLAASDGKYIYIFGGTDGNKKFDSILKYDPTNDQITILSSKLPSTLYLGSAVYDGKNFYILGGVANGSTSDKIIKYCPPSEGTTTSSTTSTPMPDLEITAADISDATYNSTSRFYKLNVVIKNKGSVDSGLFNTSLIAYNSSGFFLFNSLGRSYGYALDGDEKSPTFQINNIPAGGQITKTFLFNFYDQGSKKNFMLNFSVDFQNQVSESNENNNFVSKNVSVVTTPTTTTTTTSGCSDAFVMAYNSTSGVCDSFPVNCVPAGWTVGCAGPTTTSAGLPDLNVSSYVRTNSFYGANGYTPFTTYLNFSVSNLGTGAAGAFDVNVTVSNFTSNYPPFYTNSGYGTWYTGKTRINSLAAGAMIYLSFNVTNTTYCSGYDYCFVPSGATVNGHGRNSYYVNITADYLNEVSESNKNNNKNSTYIFWNTTNTASGFQAVIAQLLQFVGSSSNPMG